MSWNPAQVLYTAQAENDTHTGSAYCSGWGWCDWRLWLIGLVCFSQSVNRRSWWDWYDRQRMAANKNKGLLLLRRGVYVGETWSSPEGQGLFFCLDFGWWIGESIFALLMNQRNNLSIGRMMDIEYNNSNIKLLVKRTLFYNQIVYELCKIN